MYEAFVDLVLKNENKKFMIISHYKPDGDTVGSALALFEALTNIGKEVDVFCSSDFNNKLKFIPHFDRYNKKTLKSYDVAIAVDCADDKRLGDYANEFYATKKTVCIDHHGTNVGYAQLNYIRPEAAATCEFLYDILLEIDEKKKCIDNDVAKALYCGIITDSGNFQNSNTTIRTKNVAFELESKYGIKSGEIVNHFMNEITLPVFKLKNRVLSKAIFEENDTIGIIYFSIEDFNATGTTMTDTEGIINEIKNIDTVKIAVAITQQSETNYKISLRSIPSCPVDRMAASFGGGGHPCAAGFALQGSYYDVLDRVIYACKQYVD